jgi:hypothetical protein
MTISYVARAAFIPFHQRRQRWATLVTHRRAGKTIALVNDLIFAARSPLVDTTTLRPGVDLKSLPRLPDPQYAYIGPTYTQAKRVAWRYLKRYSQPWWTARPSESELKVEVAGSTIYCLGADNADSLRGMYLDGAVGDEYALWKPSVFSQVLRPALSDRNGWGVFASTPRGKNLFHEQYLKARKDPARHFLLTLRADTSGLVPPQELADLRADMDEEEFAQEYLCSFDSALKGAIYANEVNDLFLSGRVSSTPLYDPHLDTHFVYDLGFTDAMVRIAFQMPRFTGRVHIVNVTAVSGKDIFWHIDDLHRFGGPIGTVWLPHDARAKNLQTGKSIVEQFLEHDITPRIVPSHHVHDGISTARRMWPRIVIDNHPGDPLVPEEGINDDFIEAAKGYHREWDEDKLMFSDIPVHDWTSDYMDALRYLAVVVAPDLAPFLSSDNSLQSQRDALAGRFRPNLGYNLETLFLDNAAKAKRTMS